ncbi:hypothetical protein P3T73_13700 [Kiritimatiellota bacterium B12222]|nr:hypothetical protein P3T73_13700 [Kiritimatiellota bacterium B12222]
MKRLKKLCVIVMGLFFNLQAFGTQIPMRFEVPQKTNFDQFGLLIRSREITEVDGNEHRASRLFLLHDFTMVDYTYEKGFGDRMMANAFFLDADLNLVDLAVTYGATRTRSINEGLTLHLLDEEGELQSADVEPAFLELETYSGRKYRYATGKHPGYIFGELVQVTNRRGETLRMDDMGIELIRLAGSGALSNTLPEIRKEMGAPAPHKEIDPKETILRQMKTESYLVDVLQVSALVLDVSVYHLADVLPEKKGLLYQLKPDAVPVEKYLISKITPRDPKTGRRDFSKQFLEMLTFEEGVPWQEMHWQYDDLNHEYRFNMKGISDKTEYASAHYYVDDQTGLRIYDRRNNLNGTENSFVTKERYREKRDSWEKVYHRLEDGGELHFWKTDYYPKDEHGGQEKGSVFLDKSWCFHLYKDGLLDMHFKPVELRKDGRLVEPALLTEDPFVRDMNRDYCIRYADKKWMPGAAPANREEALSSPTIVIEYFNKNRVQDESTLYEKLPERIEHFRDQVRTYTEWYDFQDLEAGGQIRIHEVGYGPEAVKGGEGNQWILREYAGRGRWRKDNPKVRERDHLGNTTTWFSEKGDWDPQTETFTANEKGKCLKAVITQGVFENDQWKEGTEKVTEIRLKYRVLKHSSEELQSDGSWMPLVRARPDRTEQMNLHLPF